MVSLGIEPPLASEIALRRRGLPSGSPPPIRAATVSSLMSFVKSFPRFASRPPFLCFIVAHLEWPLMGETASVDELFPNHGRQGAARCRTDNYCELAFASRRFTASATRFARL